MDQEAIIEISKAYVDSLKKFGYAIHSAYLFGSFAKGKNGEDSDIDLAVVLRNLTNGFRIQFELMKLRRGFDLRIEPHPFGFDDFNKRNPLAREILKTGIRVA